jgi:hypothetical protein
METTILYSILRGELRPWLLSIPPRDLKDILRASDKLTVTNSLQLLQKLQGLLKPFPNLSRSVSVVHNYQIQQPLVSCNQPASKSLINTYYQELIDLEALRYYNEVISNPHIQVPELDVPFQVGHVVLKGIASLANNVNNELMERKMAGEFDSENNQTEFALVFLRNKLIALYFSIQENYKEYLKDLFNDIEEFYSYCFDESSDKAILSNSVTTRNIAPEPTTKSFITKTAKPKLSFGFKSDTKENLANLFNDLCIDYHFLNEEMTSVEDLVDLLISKDIEAAKTNIHLACPTTVFVHVIDSLSRIFPKLTAAAVANAQVFITKEKQAPISVDNYYKTRSKSKLKQETKDGITALIQKYFP